MLENGRGRSADEMCQNAQLGWVCFSSTSAVEEGSITTRKLYAPHIKRNGYKFSDGMGMMRGDLSQESAKNWK